MLDVTIRSITPEDQTWVSHALSGEWGSPIVVSRGVLHQADRLPGLVASADGQRVGLLTYSHAQTSCEIVTLVAFQPRRGIGRRLLAAMIAVARRENWARLWLVTTNDNVPAQRFYTACGWQLKTIHRGALREARKLKPQIPLTGLDDIPIEDEWEYQFILD